MRVQHGVLVCFGFGGWDVADWLQKSAVVEPVDPFQGGELNGFEVSPWPAPVNDLGLIETVDRFCQSVVVAVADAAHRRLNACFGQSLGVFDRQILAAPITVMDKAATMEGTAFVKGLFQGIEDKSRVCGAAGAPADDRARAESFSGSARLATWS